MKNENTDTINRAIHSAMGKGCWHIEASEYSSYCIYCGDARSHTKLPDYTVPGQPLEDAKAWAVEKFGRFGFATTLAIYRVETGNVYDNVTDPIVYYATLSALDMATIIFNLINEDK